MLSLCRLERSKGTLLVVLSVVCLSLFGTLTLTLMVFALPDDEDHQKSSSHRHRTNTHNPDPYVQWSVSVGEIYWDNISTFVWHSIVVRNNSDEEIDGDWEFNHHVFKRDGGWTDDDTSFAIEDIDLSPSESWSKRTSSEVYFPRNRRGKVIEGEYRITAYTEVTLRAGIDDITEGRTSKREISSVWFDVR